MGSPKIILGSRNKLAFCALCRKTLKIPVVCGTFGKNYGYCTCNGKSENFGTKIDKLELDSECGPFFKEHLKLAAKIDKLQFDSE